ncbi:MAG: HPr family phosphocarrier protein [Alphaproteobacteria bacterium]|nr:HPr family phosphocarrier protein [Alphaproteobacteria bacterium]
MSSVSRELAIINSRGLHARASAKFVRLASSFSSEITVSKDGISVNARSMLGLLTLGAAAGTAVTVSASGADADAALAALADLVAARFGEAD